MHSMCVVEKIIEHNFRSGKFGNLEVAIYYKIAK